MIDALNVGSYTLHVVVASAEMPNAETDLQDVPSGVSSKIVDCTVFRYVVRDLAHRQSEMRHLVSGSDRSIRPEYRFEGDEWKSVPYRGCQCGRNMPVETEILPGGTLEGTLTFGTCAQDSIRRHSKHPASIDKPMEFDAADRQPYTEYHPDLEDTSVAYFRSLFNLLVDSTSPDRQPTRAMAIEDIAASLAEA